jgi:integrase
MNVNKVQPFKYRLHFMRRICGRAGVKHFGFHATRHITASILYHLGYGVAEETTRIWGRATATN